MGELFRRERLALVPLAVALGVVGCGEGSNEKPVPVPEPSSSQATAQPSPTPSKLVCEATGQWTRTPTEIDTSAVANRVGVTEDQVRQGAFGTARCGRSIAFSEVTAGSVPLLDVKRIGNTCLAIGVVGDGSFSKDVFAVCVTPPLPTHSS